MIFADLEGALCRADEFCFIDNQPELEYQALLFAPKTLVINYSLIRESVVYLYRQIYIF